MSTVTMQPESTSTPQGSVASQVFEDDEHYESSQSFGNADIIGLPMARKIEVLTRNIQQEEIHIKEAMTTAEFWYEKEGRYFSKNGLSSRALMLLAQIRLDVYQHMVTRLNTINRMSISPPLVCKRVRSQFTIISILFNLTRNYYLTPQNQECSFVFIIVCNTGEKVVASELLHVTENGKVRSRRVRFDEAMVFSDLELNFQIKLEIYSLKIPPQDAVNSPKDLAIRAFNYFGMNGVVLSLFSSQNLGACKSPVVSCSKSEENPESADNVCLFKPAGYVHLNRQSIGHKSLLITDNTYPLDGTMEIKCECTSLPPELNQFTKGYWNLISADGSQRKWVEMSLGLLRFYNNSKDDGSNFRSGPNFIIDMSEICNQHVERKSDMLDDSLNTYCFYMDILSFPRGSDVCEHKRFLIDVETEDSLREWLTAINLCLDVIRGRT